MKKLLFLIILTSCQKPSMQECPYSFATEMIKGVEYKECDKDELIQDFENYITWLKNLQEKGEWRGEMMITQTPESLINSKRIFCSRGCSATHYLNDQCFLWNSPERINYQRLYRESLSEHEDKPHCEKLKISRKVKDSYVKIDYDWKNTDKHKNYRNKGYNKAGEGVLWETKQSK